MKTCLKLAIKGILVLLPLWVCIIYSKIDLFNYVSSGTITILWNNDFTNTSHDKYYDVLILGDSTANGAYVPEILSDSTINLSLAGSGVVENYYTLENYLKNNEAPTDVFISFSDYHVAQDYFTWSESNLIHKLSLAQNYEIYNNIKEYSSSPLVDVTGEDSYWSNVFLYKTYMPSKYIYSIIQSFHDDRRQENINEYNNLNTRLGRHISIDNDVYIPDDSVSDNQYKPSLLQDQYYKMLINLCDENKIHLHFIKLPVPDNVVYLDSYKQDLTNYYETLVNDSLYADFLWPCERYESCYFSDGNHFNNHGALLFSRQLRELYPNAFYNQETSTNRLEALNQDIIGENNIDFLYLWIEGFDYDVDYFESNGDTFINIKNITTGETITTKKEVLTDDGCYELMTVE